MTRIPARGASRAAVVGNSAWVAAAVAAAQRGEDGAVRFLYARHADDVHSSLRSWLRDEAQARDLTRELFMGLTRSIGDYDPRSEPFQTWLLRLARATAFDRLPYLHAVAGAGARPKRDLASASRVPTEPLEAALADLPEDQRRVLVLRHIRGLSPEEIGRRTGQSSAAVTALHHQGRAAMKALLRRLDGAPGRS